MSLNRVVLVGRLTKDPDLRYTPNGVAVTNFTIAVNRPFQNKETGKNEADFINCVVWRKPAENLAEYMKKGSQIGVDGRLQSRSYKDKDGKTVFVTEVVADSVQFLESRQSSNQSSQRQVDAYHNELGINNDPFKNGGEPIEINDDDLSF